jgi:predicted DNA-binding antitoxin AbrB/MazE fold protein
MRFAIDAVYEDGAFRPVQREAVTIPDGLRVRITVDDEQDPETLRLATRVYDGLSEGEIDEIQRIALTRGNFFGTGSTG